MSTNRYIIENSHEKIIQRKRALGYCDAEDVHGGCFGVMSAGVYAILTSGVKLFDCRVKEICETPLEKLVDEVSAAQQKFKIGDQLSDRELAMLNAHPLFFNIHLSKDTNNGKELFPYLKYIKRQDILLTSPLTLPLMLEEEGGLAIADYFSGAYATTEIIDLFKTLRETLLAHDIKHPIAFKLKSPNHTMVVGFDPDCDKWILIEANILPSQLCTAEELSDLLNRLGKFCVYSTETIVTKKNEIATVRAMKAFKNTERYKKLHAITPERLKRVNGFNGTWMHVAAGDGDVDKVQELLDQHLKLYIDINQLTSGSQHTSIWKACQEGYTKVVELLLKYGAHPDGMVAEIKADTDDLTPLGVASQDGHIDVVRLLIQAGADINWMNGEGETPLGKAAYHGHADVVQELIISGADIYLSGNTGVTALLCASQNGHTEIVRMLLDGGASPNSKALFGDDGSFETPLSRAVDNDHPDIVKLLINFGANIHDQSRNWMFHALCCKKTEIVRQFLNAGANPNEKVGSIDSQCPLLYWAITEDNYSIECIDALLKAGADPDAVSDDGDTMLLIAVVDDNVDIISSLLKANVDVNNSGSNFDPPLCLAVDGGNEAIVSMLLNAGAKVDVRDSYGQTPLFLAVNQHSSSMVSLLLAAGADPNIVRDSGATMLAYAACHGDAEIVRKLLKYKADVNLPVLTKKPDSNIIVKATAMNYARLGGSEEVIRMLEQHIQYLSCSVNNDACRFFATSGNKCVSDNKDKVDMPKSHKFM